MARLTCGKCLCGLKESVVVSVYVPIQKKYRCSVDGEYRGARTLCKLTVEQLLAVREQMDGEFLRRMPAPEEAE